jgi:MFS family permease
MGFRSHYYDIYKIVVVIIRSKKKSLIFLLLSLSLTSLSVSQIFLSTSYYKIQINIEDYSDYSRYYPHYLQGSLSTTDHYINHNQSIADFPKPSKFREMILEKINQEKLNNKITIPSVSYSLYFFSLLNQEMECLSSINLYVMPQTLTNHLIEYAYWETSSYNSSQLSILFVDVNSNENSTSNFYQEISYSSLLKQSSVKIQCLKNDVPISPQIQLNFTHKIIYEEESNSEIDEIISDLVMDMCGSGIILSESIFLSLLDSMNFNNKISPQSYSSNFPVFLRINLLSERTILDYTSDEAEKFQALYYSILEGLIEEYPLLKIHQSQAWGQGYYMDLLAIRFLLSIINFPIFILIAFLFDYLSDRVDQKQNELYNLFLIKGLSKRQYTYSKLFIFLCLIIFGFLIGFSLAIPFVKFFFSITVDSLLNKNWWNPTLSWKNILFSAITYLFFSIIVNLPNLISDIRNFSNKKRMEHRKKPYWKKTFLDLFFLVIGLFGIILLFYSNNIQSGVSMAEGNKASLLIPISFICGPVFIIGLTLFSSRLLSFISKRVKENNWFNRKKLFSFSLKSIFSKEEGMSSKVMVCALGITFLIYLLSVPFANNTTSQIEAGYNIGADARVNLIQNTSYNEIVDELPSTIDYSFAQKVDYYYNTYDNRIISFFMVNPSSYHLVAYWNTNAIDLSLKEACNQLKESKSCLAERRGLNYYNIRKNDELIITTNKNKSSFSHLTIVESFKLWPFLSEIAIADNEFTQNSALKIVVSLETGQELFKNQDGIRCQNFLFLDLSNYDGEKSSLKKSLESREDVTEVVFKSEEFNRLRARSTLLMSSTISFMNFIITVFTVTLVIVLFGIEIYTYRRKEIALFLSLGATFKQLFAIFYTELFIIFLISLPIGFFNGCFISIFAIFLQSSINTSIFFPNLLHFFLIMLAFSCVIFIINLVIVVLPLLFLKKIELSKTIKGVVR